MSEPRYVQHKSGYGNKWELLYSEINNDLHSDVWNARSQPGMQANNTFLPRVEYGICEPQQPPERWVNVTSECRLLNDTTVAHDGRTALYACEAHYRIRLKQVHEKPNYPSETALIVEKKEPT